MTPPVLSGWRERLDVDDHLSFRLARYEPGRRGIVSGRFVLWWERAGWGFGPDNGAFPVFGPEGRVVASVSITGPSTRLNPERAVELAAAVRRAADEVSRRLGGESLGTDR